MAAVGVKIGLPDGLTGLSRVVFMDGHTVVREPFGQQEILARPDDHVVQAIAHTQVDEVSKASRLRIRSVHDVGPIAVHQLIDALPGVKESVRAGGRVQGAVDLHGRRVRIDFHLRHLQ